MRFAFIDVEKALYPQPRVGHIVPEFGRLANVLLGRGCGNPALITYRPPRRAISIGFAIGRRK